MRVPPEQSELGAALGLRAPETGGAKNTPSSEERALLRRLKEVTDKQRDELRAHNRDLLRRSQETEALQEQLQRLLLVNSELRHKLAAVQTQLRAAQDRERERQIARDDSRQLAKEQSLEPDAATPDDPVRTGAESKYTPELTAFSSWVCPAWVCHAM